MLCHGPLCAATNDRLWDVLQQGLEFEPTKTCAVMVGHKEMCEAVTKILESKGVSKDHILLNF